MMHMIDYDGVLIICVDILLYVIYDYICKHFLAMLGTEFKNIMMLKHRSRDFQAKSTICLILRPELQKVFNITKKSLVLKMLRPETQISAKKYNDLPSYITICHQNTIIYHNRSSKHNYGSSKCKHISSCSIDFLLYIYIY